MSSADVDAVATWFPSRYSDKLSGEAVSAAMCHVPSLTAAELASCLLPDVVHMLPYSLPSVPTHSTGAPPDDVGWLLPELPSSIAPEVAVVLNHNSTEADD